MEIVALSGFARAGKDEAAAVLVNEFGFTQVAFADKLRQMLYALNPLVSHTLYYRSGGHFAAADVMNKSVFIQDVIDTFGWDGYKETPYGPEVRRLLQRLGTEAGRQTLWDTIWIDAAFAGLADDAKVVVSDARFFNEFDAVRWRGGEVWRIERNGVGPQSDHPSEMEAVDYSDFSQYINNNGSLDDYRNAIRNACARRWQTVGFTTA